MFQSQVVSMKKLVLLPLLISAWGLLVFAPTTCAISWDVGSFNANQYATFLTQLRNTAKDSKLKYFDIPMMPKAVTPPKYILVVLTSTNHNSLTLALNANDLYVVAYSDRYKDKPRAYFFPDAPSNAKTTLFLDAKTANQSYTMSYESRYASLESKAKTTRSKLGLGVQKLNNRLNKIYGEALNEQDQAEFLLIAIQTVSEATRFSYIETQIKNNIGKFEFTPDPKVLNLENEWGKISAAVRNAKANGDFKAAIKLVDAKGKTYDATKVSDVKGDIALLKYVA